MGIEIGIDWLSLLLFGSLGLLLMLGLPMAFCTGSLATIFLLRVRQRRDPQHDAVADLPVHDGLPALRGPAVHLHGGGAGEGGDHRGAVRRHLQVARRAQGRPRLGDGRGLHPARGDGRRRRRHRGDDGHDRAARDAPAQLRAEARLRLAARGRHARHPDSAVGDGDRLRGRRAAVAGRAADRLGVSGTAAVRALHRLRDDSLLHQSRRSGPRCRSRSASTCARSCACCATRSRRCSDHSRARRHLLRHRDAGRGRRHRHVRRARRLRAAPPAYLGRALRGRDRDAEGDGDGDVDLLRRDDVRRLLHHQGRPDVRLRPDSRHRPAAVRDPVPDDGRPVRPRDVPRLGRHPAAHRADLPADHDRA